MVRPLSGAAKLYVDKDGHTDDEPLFQPSLHIWEQGLVGLLAIYDGIADPIVIAHRTIMAWEEILGSGS